jgi:endonuclease III
MVSLRYVVMVLCLFTHNNRTKALRSLKNALHVQIKSLTKFSMVNMIVGARSKTWKDDYAKITTMRSSVIAPVDTMGASALALSEPNQSSEEFRFATLIVTMLSPQTKDQQTSIAYNRLRDQLRPQPFLASTLRASLSEDMIAEAIRGVSFHRVKAKNILTAVKAMDEKFHNDLPKHIEDLLAFPGVGPKIAYLTFTIAWNKTEGICVDTHVHRITNRLGWVDTFDKSNGPEKTRLALESFLPRDVWHEINGLFVGFGQSICDAKKPKCNICLLKSTCKYHNEPSHMRKE